MAKQWIATPHTDEMPWAVILDVSDYQLSHYRVKVLSVRERFLGHTISQGRRRPIEAGDEFEIDNPPSADVLARTFETVRSWWHDKDPID